MILNNFKEFITPSAAKLQESRSEIKFAPLEQNLKVSSVSTFTSSIKINPLYNPVFNRSNIIAIKIDDRIELSLSSLPNPKPNGPIKPPFVPEKLFKEVKNEEGEKQTQNPYLKRRSGCARHSNGELKLRCIGKGN